MSILNLCVIRFSFAFLFLLIRSYGCGPVDNDGHPKPYDVILVIFDDMRPAIGSYGDSLASTPNLNAFISESYFFTRAYCQQALCAPSRNSLLTSRRPDTLRLYDFYSYWRTYSGNFTTLPQYFLENGYYTYSIGKVFHPGLSSNNTDDYPYSWSEKPYRPKTEKFMNSPVCPDSNGSLRKNLICPVHLQTQPYKTLPDIESVAEGIRFLQSQNLMNSRKPFFLALGLHKPHINFRFPYQFLNRFKLSDFFNYTADHLKPNGMPNVAWNPYTDIRSRDDFKCQNISFPYGPISPLQSAQIRQAYYASIAYVDDLFGKFIEYVDRSHTIVVVTSDHGWSLGEHAEWAKYSNFDVATRVPLIIHSPDFPLTSGKKIKQIVELLDIFPTLVDLANLPTIPACNQYNHHKTCTEGKSLYSFLNNATDMFYSNNYALSQYPRPGMQPTKHPNSDKPKLKSIKVMGYSIRTEHFRYTLWVRFYPNNFTKDWSFVYGEEMYDHRFDVGEEKNISEMPQFQGIRLWLRQILIMGFRKQNL